MADIYVVDEVTGCYFDESNNLIHTDACTCGEYDDQEVRVIN